MKRLIISIIMLLTSLTFLFAGNQIKYVGSSTVGAFIKDAAKVYKQSAFNINTKPESGGGESATARGISDIGGVAREVKPEILKQGVKKFLIGKDAIGVLVNKSNPVDDISKENLKKIFTGKITNWKEIGGENHKITVYIVKKQSATRKVFKKVILGKEKYNGKNIQTITPDTKIVDKIASDNYGIGQLSFALVNNHGLKNKVKKVKISGQNATVNNPNYPITRPLHLITKGDPKGDVKKFIDWSLSVEGQKVLKKNFIGI